MSFSSASTAFSPTALGDTGNVTFESQFSKTEPTQRKLSNKAARTSAQPTPIAKPNLKFLRLVLFYYLGGCSHRCPFARSNHLAEGKVTQPLSLSGTAYPVAGATFEPPRRYWPL